jgi:hypothetical protein
LAAISDAVGSALALPCECRAASAARRENRPMATNAPQFTREDAARVSSLVAGHLLESSYAAHEIKLACEAGAAHAREFGSSRDSLDGAREIRARIDALLDFVNGGKAYIDWLASRGR